MNDAPHPDPSETIYQDKSVFFQGVPEELLQVFIRNVQIHMAHQRLSDKTLAMAAELTQKTVNNVLKGRHNNRVDNLIKIANALKVDFWMLWIPETPIDPELTRQFTRQFKLLLSAAAKLPLTALKQLADNAQFLLTRKPPDPAE